VYNYDYVLDHIFHLNGAIELRGSTSGYLQSTFWYAQLELYLAFCVLCVCVVSSGTYDLCPCSVRILMQSRRTVIDGTVYMSVCDAVRRLCAGGDLFLFGVSYPMSPT
jgi:hypothetical protein